MDYRTREELLALRKSEGVFGTEAEDAINKRLYDDPNILKVVIELHIADPIGQLEETANAIGHKSVPNTVADELMGEIAPEWYSRRGGADWWISKFGVGPQPRTGGLDWTITEEPFPAPPPPTNPHFQHDIQVLCQGQEWYEVDDNGDPGDSYEVVNLQPLHWYCVTCDEEYPESITNTRYLVGRS